MQTMNLTESHALKKQTKKCSLNCANGTNIARRGVSDIECDITPCSGRTHEIIIGT